MYITQKSAVAYRKINNTQKSIQVELEIHTIQNYEIIIIIIANLMYIREVKISYISCFYLKLSFIKTRSPFTVHAKMLDCIMCHGINREDNYR